MKAPSNLFSYAHDGKLFYKAVMKRLSKLDDVSLNELCVTANIEFSTAWRWNNDGRKPTTDTVNAVEKALSKLEAAQTTSSMGIKPTALR